MLEATTSKLQMFAWGGPQVSLAPILVTVGAERCQGPALYGVMVHEQTDFYPRPAPLLQAHRCLVMLQVAD